MNQPALAALLAKEFRTQMRGSRPAVLLASYLALLLLALFWLYQTLVGQVQQGVPLIGPQIGQALFVGLTLAVQLLLVFLAPATTLNSISSEHERHTYDILLATPLSAAGMVLAKLLVGVAFVGLLIIAALPLYSIVVLFGGGSGGRSGAGCTNCHHHGNHRLYTGLGVFGPHPPNLHRYAAVLHGAGCSYSGHAVRREHLERTAWACGSTEQLPRGQSGIGDCVGIGPVAAAGYCHRECAASGNAARLAHTWQPQPECQRTRAALLPGYVAALQWRGIEPDLGCAAYRRSPPTPPLAALQPQRCVAARLAGAVGHARLGHAGVVAGGAVSGARGQGSGPEC